MRIVFFDSDYTAVLDTIYGKNPESQSGTPYGDLLGRRNATLFARLDFLVDALAGLGHEVEGFYFNNLPLQAAWLRDQGTPPLGQVPAPRGNAARIAAFRLRRLASHTRMWANRRFGDGNLRPQAHPLLDTRNPLVYEIAAEQIARLRPDIIYNHDPALIDGQFFRSVSGFSGKLVAQIASPYPENTNWRAYDLVISSLPNFVERFRQQGIPSAYLPLYFAPQVLTEVPARERDLALSFVGTVSPVHAARQTFLEDVARRLPLSLYGSFHGDPAATPLGASYRGLAWGRDMYAVLARSQITLNRHIDVAGDYANNLRLFEATGMGACLVTERARNLSDLFDPEREVVTYGSSEECIELCGRYIAHPGESAAIAAAGQRRCLADHTVARHAEKLAAILRDRL